LLTATAIVDHYPENEVYLNFIGWANAHDTEQSLGADRRALGVLRFADKCDS
jgi:hypothetical protein